MAAENLDFLDENLLLKSFSLDLNVDFLYENF